MFRKLATSSSLLFFIVSILIYTPSLYSEIRTNTASKKSSVIKRIKIKRVKKVIKKNLGKSYFNTNIRSCSYFKGQCGTQQTTSSQDSGGSFQAPPRVSCNAILYRGYPGTLVASKDESSLIIACSATLPSLRYSDEICSQIGPGCTSSYLNVSSWRATEEPILSTPYGNAFGTMCTMKIGCVDGNVFGFPER